ncbi:MAG: MATE family efflux transporter [Bacteroides sp. SM1_62]|nr:MAG: MATE family efflux transporter [Bacteroides sp. SM23_62]KPL25215.1 MAG: MATE family efflux transporter [Bacteroides sp. SM1_62]
MKELTRGNEARLIFNFAMPMLLGNLFQQLYNIVDTIIVGNFLGKEALAAVGASFPIVFTLISLIIGVASGGTIVIAQYFGARDHDSVRRAIHTMYIFLTVASVVLTLVGIPLTEEIFRLIRLPEEIMPEATTYLAIYLSGLIASFGFNATSAILRGLGDSKTPLYFLMISTFFNIMFDLLFILVFGWGIAGAAIATVISQAGAFLTAVLYLHRNHKLIDFNLPQYRFDRKIFWQSLRIGLPTGFQHTFVSLGMMAIMAIVNTFGTNVIAGYSAALRIDSLAILPAMNFSAALATFVGQNIGAGRSDRVRRGLIATLLMSSGVSVSVMAVVIFLKYPLMGMFTSDTEVIRIGGEYLVIVSSFYLLFTAMFKINGVLRGAGDTLIPMFITLTSLWVIRIPFAWFFSRSLGETGIWWSVPASWGVGLLLSFLYYLTGRWKTRAVVKPQVANS